MTSFQRQAGCLSLAGFLPDVFYLDLLSASTFYGLLVVTAATHISLPPQTVECNQIDVCTRPRAVSICHIASGDAWGGAEAQIATLVIELASRPGVRVCAIVLNSGRLAEELIRAGVNTTVIPESTSSFFQLLSRAQQVVTSAGAEIVHSHRYKENLIASVLGMRNRRLRLVRTQHGRPERFTGLHGIKQRTVYALDRLATRFNADGVVSVSSELRTYLQPYVPREKIAIIPNGVAQRPRSLSRAEAKKKFHLENPTVGFVGRLEHVKRPDLFIETARRIAQQVPGIQFVIAGSGRQEQLLQQLVTSCGMEQQIKFLGHCSESNELLRALDLLLVTSDEEGLPMVVLEAMAAGTPVVARAVGGIPEVITHGQTGWLVQNHDPSALANVCIRVLRDRSLRERITTAARTLVEARFSAKSNADRMLEIYRSLCFAHAIAA